PDDGGARRDRSGNDRRRLAGRRLDETSRRRGLERAQALRLGADDAPLADRTRLRAVAADPAQPQGTRQAGLLSGLRPEGRHARRTRRRGRPSLDDRGVFRARQERSRPRSLRSALLARLASPHDPRHGRRGFSRQTRRRPQAIGLRQSERKESGEGFSRLSRIKSLIPSAPEIRTLLARLFLSPRFARPFALAWSYWRRQHQAVAANAHYKRQNKLQTQL